MRKLFLAFALTLSLAGCANLNAAWNAATTAQVPDNALVVIDDGVHAAQVSLASYLRLPLCSPPTVQQNAACSSVPMANKLRPAMHGVMVARDNAIAFARTHDGELGASGLYDAFTKALDTFNQIAATLPPAAQAALPKQDTTNGG